jgi:hypothetical protein
MGEDYYGFDCFYIFIPMIIVYGNIVDYQTDKGRSYGHFDPFTPLGANFTIKVVKIALKAPGGGACKPPPEIKEKLIENKNLFQGAKKWSKTGFDFFFAP